MRIEEAIAAVRAGKVVTHPHKYGEESLLTVEDVIRYAFVRDKEESDDWRVVSDAADPHAAVLAQLDAWADAASKSEESAVDEIRLIATGSRVAYERAAKLLRGGAK